MDEATLQIPVLEPRTDAAPHDYPDHLTRSVQLADGTPVTIRAMRHDDTAHIHDLVERLSPRSRYLRFFTAVQRISPALLASLIRIDFGQAMALVCIAATAEGERGIGVAHYAVLPGTRRCEFAIAVDDEWHGTGIARELMNGLLAAACLHHDLEEIEGITLAENESMLRLARSLGFATERDRDDSRVIKMRRPL